MLQRQSEKNFKNTWNFEYSRQILLKIVFVIFLIIEAKIGTIILRITFFGLKEAILLSLVTSEIENTQEENTLILTHEPSKMFIISA